MKLAIDAMGGDRAPFIVLEGVKLFLNRHKEKVEIFLFGDEEILLPLVIKHNLQNNVKIVHTSLMVKAEEKPATVLRNRENTSMYLAITALRDGKVDCVISAGNTGVLMALSLFVLKRIAMVQRPGIIQNVPTVNGETSIIDLGANIECSAKNLIQFAIMGNVYAKITRAIKKPRVAILNVGVEDNKGKKELHDAAKRLKKIEDINYIGFVEADELRNGYSDVLVTDGFTGNVMLKSIEGASVLFANTIKQALKKSIFAKLGLLFMLFLIRGLRKKIDSRVYNGAILLGVKGIVVKSHGSADGFSFSMAISRAHKAIKGDLLAKVKKELELVGDNLNNAKVSE